MNLKQEERQGYFITSEMKKVWDIQLRCVKKVLEVCENHNLKIWAEGGTLLGAIRENGYIPWDDDIDLVMMRDDYDKLLKIASDEFSDPYFFQCAYTDKTYPRGHAQLRYRGTTAILPGDVDCKFDQSIFIDIFVYDNLPSNKFSLSSKLFKSELYRQLLSKRTYSKIEISNPKATIETILIGLLFLLVPFKKIFRRFDAVFTEEDESSSQIACVSFCMASVFYALDKKFFEKTLYVPFEDITMPVPGGYNEILTILYGDYMTPVKAPSMHGGVIFDTERSYTEVLKDIKSGKIDIKKYLNE